MTESLISISFDPYPNDLYFIVNENAYPTKRFVADLLSPKIRKLHLTDKAFDQLSMQTVEERNFTNILNIAIKGKQAFSSSKMKYVYEFFLKLGNFDFIDSISFFSEEIALKKRF